ncbi:MAG: S-layer protein [Theionarchaea archaeon]|nr:S-layer protein [Theionarchaea archaeon]
MKSEKVKATITGLFLVSAVMTGVPTQEVPLDFFVNPETGEPAMIIVVGSTAASEDVVSATNLAGVIGTLCAGGSDATFGEKFTAVHENITYTNLEPLTDRVFYEGSLGFPTSDVPDAGLYGNWENRLIPLNYTLPSLWYFNDSNAFWSYDYGHFQPWETHEEIQIRFDLNESSPASCLPYLYGMDIMQKKSPDELDLSNWPRVPGLIYRADNIFAPPLISVEMWFSYTFPQVTRLMRPRFFTIPEPWMVMQGMLPQFKLFNTLYTVVDAGPISDKNSLTGEKGALHGTPYMVTGQPHFQTHILMYLNNPLEFGPYTLELVDVRHSTAEFEFSSNDESMKEFWLISDTSDGFAPNLQDGFPFDHYETCNDLNRNKKLDPGEATNVINMDYKDYDNTVFDMWIVDHTGEVWVDYRWEYYMDDDEIAWLLFEVVNFAIDSVRVFTNDQGTGVEIQVYWLENEEVWYNHMCSDPWTANPDYQVFLDAYQAGWDEIHGNSYLYQPPGTGLWPPMGLNLWKSAGTMFIGNGFLDSNDGHTGYEYYLSEGYLPEHNDLDRDKGTTNDCRNAAWELQESCQNQHDVEDPVVQHGAGVILMELNVCVCDSFYLPHSEVSWVISGPVKERPYFTIEVLDVRFCDDGIDYNTLMELVDTTNAVDIDETGLVFLDSDIDFTEWKSACRYNMILIGGPVANTLVSQLVKEGISTVNWTSSAGEWEYIAPPYNGCHILIVAGSDRDATKAAVLRLIDYLET